MFIWLKSVFTDKIWSFQNVFPAGVIADCVNGMVKMLIAKPGFNTTELINVRFALTKHILIFFAMISFGAENYLLCTIPKGCQTNCTSYNLKIRQNIFTK